MFSNFDNTSKVKRITYTALCVNQMNFFLYSFKIVLKRKLSKGNLSIKKKLFSFSKLQEIYRSLRLFTKIELFKNVQVFLLHFYLFCFILNEKKYCS